VSNNANNLDENLTNLAGKSLSNNAFLSFIAGIMGITILPILGSTLAIILGNRAKQEIDQNWGTMKGETFAQVGVILGWVGLGLSFLSVCLAGMVILGAILILTLSLGLAKLGFIIPFFIFI
jgi:hypothetical protein